MTLTVAKEECSNLDTPLSMVLLKIGMIWNCCGNMPSFNLKYHQISILFYWLNQIWTQVNKEKEYLKSSLKNFKFLPFSSLIKESFHCIKSYKFRFATGKSTGIVVDSGDGVTHVVPVYEGYSIENACQRIDLGGRDVTEHLRNLMRKSGINMNTTA